MMIQSKIGNLSSFPPEGRTVDRLLLEWHQTGKRILHASTASGRQVTLKFLKEAPAFTQDDVVYADHATIIAVEIAPADAIIIVPKDMYGMASICYETGNKHLPLFYYRDELLIPFDAPFYRLLHSLGYQAERGNRQLLQPLKTTVAPHGHMGDTLFSRIMKLSTSNE
jgi:urease accessory protein